MADSELQVTFSGDASGLKTAAGDAQSAISSVVSGLDGSQDGLDQFRQAMATAFQAPDIGGLTAATAQVAAAVQAAMTAVADAAQAGGDAVVSANKNAADKVPADWKASVGATTQTFADGLLKMAQGSESFSKVINQTAERIETYFVNACARMISEWLYHETTKSAGTAAGVAARTSAETAGQSQTLAMSAVNALKNIVNQAAQAAAGAYQAIAPIPIIGPVAAPIAAAGAFAGVMAFEGLVSAAGGYDIPAGLDPLVQAHAQEMILPARIANPLRDMLSSYAPGSAPAAAPGAASAGSGGDVHNWTISALDPRSFETYLRRNSDVLAGALTAKVRAGAKIAGV